MNSYKALGLMSGTSLDGVDIAFVHFEKEEGKWHFEWLNTACIEYDSVWKTKLQQAPSLTGLELSLLHQEYGFYLGNIVREFILTSAKTPDLIASHGHTVFHQPEKKLTLQIGSGQAIANVTGIKTVTEFRTKDVLMGGQGAPLVPIGDALLFSDYDFCLNIGGIANISFRKNNERYAYDICPANIMLNALASERGLSYDDRGMLSQQGKINTTLLEALNELPFYESDFPKSLGREWVDKNIFPLINSFTLNTEDALATCCEHIAFQIGRVASSSGTMLVTGGGAWNDFLIERIKHYSFSEIIIPDKNIVNFKEALIFALLGVLRLREEINCLKSVTGAEEDSVGGVVYF